jgi:Putative auto-transporter adhesin, head GIN domain
MLRRVFRFGLYASALAIGAVIGCSAFNGVEGSGTPASEEREVGDITEVVVAGGGELLVVPGDTTGLVVTADDNLLPLIDAHVSHHKLTLRTKSGHSLMPKTPIRFTLFVKRLDKLTISGSGNATAEGLVADGLEVKLSGAGHVTLKKLQGRELKLELSGAGNATLDGQVKHLEAKLSGAGGIDAGELQTASAEMTISGAGNAVVWASDELKARVSGAGDIKYRGSPKVDQKVSGAGSIRPITR